MDCTIFAWETGVPYARFASGHLETRELLRRHLRMAFPPAEDDRFSDLVKALDQADNDR